MSKVVPLYPVRIVADDAVAIIERRKPKTPESKLRVAEMVEDCKAMLKDKPQHTLVGTMLVKSVDCQQEQIDDKAFQEYRRLEAVRAKGKIAEWLAVLVKNSSAAEAIDHIRQELKAIGCLATVGSEEH